MKTFSKRSSRSLRGAALTEYGIVVGLIAVFSIAAVSQLGTQVKDIFGLTTSELDKNTSHFDVSGSSSDTPVASLPLAWTMTSGTDGPSTGYRDAVFQMEHGSNLVEAEGSELRFLSFLHYADGYNLVYFMVHGDEVDYLTSRPLTLRCDGLSPLNFSEAKNIEYALTSVPDGRTVATWDVPVTPFTNGQNYSCDIGPA